MAWSAPPVELEVAGCASDAELEVAGCGSNVWFFPACGTAEEAELESESELESLSLDDDVGRVAFI